MRHRIVAGNWKMNKTLDEAIEMALFLQEHREDLNPRVEILLAPPSLYLVSLEMIDEPVYNLAAQNCSDHDYGAFTGEISAAMLREINVYTCLVGHSERRQYFSESDEWLAKKVDACLRHDVRPVLCCGEKLEERKEHRHFVRVLHQLERALYHLEPGQMKKVVIAYEPVWAIGTGQTATAEQAQEMHDFIRQSLSSHFGSDVADYTPILYGGSVNPSNAEELFACPDVDGALVGGASLHRNDFLAIIKAMS